MHEWNFRKKPKLSVGLFVYNEENILQERITTIWFATWLINNDRGEYIRPLNDLHKLFEETGCEIVESSELRMGPVKSRAILAVRNEQSSISNHS